MPPRASARARERGLLRTVSSDGRPPARRATDRYLAAGFVGLALLVWIVVGRRLVLGEYAVALLYGVPAVLVTYAAVGMVILLRRRWGR